MPPAARLGDPHVCPLHGGGVIGPPCAPTVLIGGMPAARLTDICICGPPNAIVFGSPTVLIMQLPAARMGDPTAHGGTIAMGCPTVMIGLVGAGKPVGTGMGNVLACMSATTSSSSTGSGGPGGGDTPPDTPQSTALMDAGQEGIPMVEKCPYADH